MSYSLCGYAGLSYSLCVHEGLSYSLCVYEGLSYSLCVYEGLSYSLYGYEGLQRFNGDAVIRSATHQEAILSHARGAITNSCQEGL